MNNTFIKNVNFVHRFHCPTVKCSPIHSLQLFLPHICLFFPSRGLCHLNSLSLSLYIYIYIYIDNQFSLYSAKAGGCFIYFIDLLLVEKIYTNRQVQLLWHQLKTWNSKFYSFAIMLYFDPSTRPKNANPRWCTGRKWHIPMASNRKRSRGRIKAYDMGQGEGPIVPLQWCTGRE